MRQIEEQMVKAVQEREPFISGNTAGYGIL